ncbi:MAG TPA: hypothetical protein H9742_11355 [Candidatus Acetatifactor stercoripullorum]|uniref:SAF domain-containing protein n=1 Tax=Candidatus Acetatifactor stercoripullorum TaxID=2838414 RepID=A0A9D1R713_9FIRM|nr:SAF domain-containing protein [uncultured Acetatifactor sp.]HIW82089.1 hypothetical protein [Candidatus Acetatifactor stercoripullorum]
MKLRKKKKLESREAGAGRGWIISIAAAFIAALAVYGVMLSLEKNMLTQYEKGCIYVAARQIPEGQYITEENCGDYFVKKELDKSCIPQTAISSPKQVQGLIAITGIEEGVLLTEGMFEELNEITSKLENPVIAGFKAEDLYQVAGGVLRSGDRIHIYSVKEEGKEASTVWKNVFVQQVFDTSGNRISNEDGDTAAQRINIYLAEEDVERFYEQLSAGSLRAVKVCD